MNLQEILEKHELWIQGKLEGVRADLRGADLREADLWGADLRGADLQGADLQDADLQDADLQDANLRWANLRWAYLQDANLRGADLRGADLQGADLQDANLRGANLRGANLRDADLQGANLPDFQICPETGAFDAWKKTGNGVIKIRIPASAKRISSLVGRKCRAAFVKVLKGSGYSPIKKLYYEEGKIVHADSFDDDIRVECSHGIHFFMTKEEAEEFYQ